MVTGWRLRSGWCGRSLEKPDTVIPKGTTPDRVQVLSLGLLCTEGVQPCHDESGTKDPLVRSPYPGSDGLSHVCRRDGSYTGVRDA